MILYKIIMRCDCCGEEFDIQKTEILAHIQNPPCDIRADISRYKILLAILERTYPDTESVIMIYVHNVK